MSDLADLFPGFDSHWITTSIGNMFARSGGEGAPLLLLHGYAQTHVMWHKVAPKLAERFKVVLIDLPGYGWSAVPTSGKGHMPYDKRSMANVMIEAMEKLGHIRFHLAGHDRGGRVGYRLALDHPGRLIKLAVLDIIPTFNMWHGMDHALAMKAWHWPLLAKQYPMPELLLTKAPVEYLNWKMASQTKTKDLTPFDPRALAHYHAFFSDPLRIHATCEDYRAAETTDLANDEIDHAARKKIGVPVLALWGDAGLPSEKTPLSVWREWCKDVTGKPINSGHYLAEENPEATAKALLEFFRP
jgi:haloacetate dehalogenase